MNSNYYKARKYAWMLVGNQSLDLLHDAYLTWYKKCQGNLFEEHERTVIAVVKLEWKQRVRSKLRVINGELVPKMLAMKDEWEPVGNYQQHTIDFETLLSVLPFNDTARKLSEGYTQVEIAEMDGLTKQCINLRIKKMRSCLK